MFRALALRQSKQRANKRLMLEHTLFTAFSTSTSTFVDTLIALLITTMSTQTKTSSHRDQYSLLTHVSNKCYAAKHGKGSMEYSNFISNLLMLFNTTSKDTLLEEIFAT